MDGKNELFYKRVLLSNKAFVALEKARREYFNATGIKLTRPQFYGLILTKFIKRG
jgi:hypothetical protein